MDEFKLSMTNCCGVGGLKCFCCNPTFNTRHTKNSKAILRQTARAKLKNNDRKLINNLEN
jgi:hypothetical protein